MAPRPRIPALFIAAALAAVPATSAAAQVKYSWRGGGIQEGIPLVGGRTYTFEIVDLHPLCYSYGAELAVKEENADLSRIVSAFGTLPGTASTGAGAGPTTPPSPPTPPPPPPPPPPPAPVTTDAVPTPAREARAALSTAVRAIQTLDGNVRAVEPLVREVGTPTCGRGASFAALQARWEAAELARDAVGAGDWRLSTISDDLLAARIAAGEVTDAATKKLLEDEITKAAAAADALAAKLRTLLPELATADRAMAGAADQQRFVTQAYLPAGTSSVELAVRATELRPEPGKPAATIEQKTNVPLRRGPRVFLSAGFLASTVSGHDYERANRPCPDSPSFPCDTIYSTYVDRQPGRGFAFSPVLQANVAFRDWFGTGMSFHTSAGVATRSVNGGSGAEFVLGAGAGLLDRFLLTAGIHFARDETLLLGDPAEVRSRPVSDKITPADAVSTVWRRGFFTTVTLRLN